MNTLYAGLILLILSLSAGGQSVGIIGGKLWSDNYEIEDPPGAGIILAYPAAKKITVRLAYQYFTNTRTYIGPLLGGFMQVPKPPTIEQTVESQSVLHGIDLSAMLSVVTLPFADAGFGASFGKYWLRGDRKGLDSGESISLNPADKYGFGLLFYLETVELWHSGLRLNLILKKKSLRSSPAPTDMESPLSRSLNISQLLIGLIYQF